MIKFEQIESVSYGMFVDLLPPYLSKIQPDLMIIGNRLILHPEDTPFLLALNKKEKRIGVIEILKPSKEFPGQILTHAAWVGQNSFAIANLNKNEFNPDLSPFVIGLVSSYPDWLNITSYIKLDITLFKYTAITYQGSPGLIFDPLFEPSPSRKKPEQTRPLEEKITPLFRSEGFYEMGLTEEEIRYFSN